jgi:hypothetical protein
MTRIPICSRLLTPFLLAASLSLVVAPQEAEAHSKHAVGHESAADHAEGAVATETVYSTNHYAVAGWSRSCPGRSGDACCCDGKTTCTGIDKLPIDSSDVWSILAPPAIRGLNGFRARAPLSLLRPLPPSPPRGPPIPS